MKKMKLNKIMYTVIFATAIVFIAEKLQIVNNLTDTAFAESISDSGYDFKYENGVQVIEFDLSSRGYPTININAKEPVRLVINVDEDDLYSCNFRLISQELGIQYQFEEGQNIIEFTIDEPGQYYYSCWMGMLGAYINVYDQVVPSIEYNENITQGGSCCSIQ